jgi:glucosamine-6-phosphate deaminase
MEIIRCASEVDVAIAVADRVVALLRGKPDARIGFPTGKTPVLFYRELARRKAAGLDTTRMRAFGLDEYWGIEASHPQSFAAFLRTHLIIPLGIPPENVLCVNGAAADPAAEGARYEAALAAGGGIDMVILGLGANGHVAFNEPGSPRDSRTRVLSLATDTVASVRSDFPPGTKVPGEAVSIGIATILSGREILLLVTGEKKAEILKKALLLPKTEAVPASLIRDHPRFTLIVDRGAARDLP